MHLRIDRRGFVEWLTSDFLAWLAGAIAMILAVLAVWLAFQFAAKPTVAMEYPIAIPAECVELAERDGVPLIIENRTQAMKAKAKLAMKPKSDPLARECRAAVARLKAEMK